METLTLLSEAKCWGGRQLRYRHESVSCACPMTFSLYLPPQAENAQVPVLYWLSGLTCTDENFVQKAGAQHSAAQHGIAIFAPDTSPRSADGIDVPDDPDKAYDFGHGAGFYVNATQDPWAKNYHMYDYIVSECPALLKAHISQIDVERCGIFGHSMGGHGALTIALRNPTVYRSVSAFAPIVAPSQVPWGEKALSTYLGSNKTAWELYDSCCLIEGADKTLELFIDQGEADNFLHTQLRPHLLEAACKAHGHPLTLRMQPGYDHSYFFIASFMADHLMHHAAALFR